MTTTVVKSIGTNARDYSTIDAWEDDTDNTSLVAADEIREGQCYNDSEFVVTSQIWIVGATTDATRYRRLTTAAGQSFRDHANRLTNPLRYDVAKGVGVRKATSYAGGTCIRWDENNGSLENLQLKQEAVSGSRSALEFGPTGATFRNILGHCDSNATNGSIQAGGTGNKLINSIAIVDDPRAPGIGTGYSDPVMLNCTVVCPSDATVTGTCNGINRGSGSSVPTAKNCAVFGPWTNCFSGTLSAASDYNAASDATAPGAHSLINLVFADQFENVTTATEDYRAKASGSLDGAATPDSDTNGEDIIGQSRSATTPTIGAWEVVSAGGGGGSSDSLMGAACL